MKYTMIATAPELAGYEVEEHLGVVNGVSVRTTSFAGALVGFIQGIFGGKISTYTKLCKDARSESFDEMHKNAIKLGANAIISVRYDATEIAYMTEVLSYGTAVIVRPKPRDNS